MTFKYFLLVFETYKVLVFSGRELLMNWGLKIVKPLQKFWKIYNDLNPLGIVFYKDFRLSAPTR